MAYLESKPRYEVLDGLRGVAALCVVGFHMMECYSADITNNIMAHGYLAVDFFFALSGYVLGYAYQDRFDQMGYKGFFKRRIARLHPMLLIGVLMGIIFFYYSGSVGVFGAVDSAPWHFLMLQAVLTLFCIPFPQSWDIRGWGELSSINGPVWTLIYEYIANILYAFIFRFLPTWGLAILAMGSAVLTADIALNLNIFGNLTETDYFYYINGGFVFNPEHVYLAFTRLLYPFLIGLLMSRMGKMIKSNHGFLITSLIVFGMFNVPKYMGGGNIVDGAYQLFCVLVLFPLVLVTGAGSKVTGKVSTKVCKFLGDISFPLYITHYPVLYMHMSWAQRHLDSPVSTHIFVAITTTILVIMNAWAALKLYDLPVRAWLKEHWLKK